MVATGPAGPTGPHGLTGPTGRSESWASMVLSGDRIYVNNQAGDVFILKASSKFELLATNALAQVGPNYQRPATETAPQFKGVTWRAATPAAHLPKGEWWKVYRDSKLSELEARATAEGKLKPADPNRPARHLTPSLLRGGAPSPRLPPALRT
mgnify:CR=1 FL=1